jgi:hypothetical protein
VNVQKVISNHQQHVNHATQTASLVSTSTNARPAPIQKKFHIQQPVAPANKISISINEATVFPVL